MTSPHFRGTRPIADRLSENDPALPYLDDSPFSEADDHSLLDQPAPVAFFRIAAVLRITGLSRPTLYRRIAAKKFPPPVHLGGRACGWRREALLAWVKNPEGYADPCEADPSTIRRRGRPRKYMS